MPDLRFFNGGSIVTMTPETDRGRDWITDNILAEPDVLGAGHTVYIEPRYLEDIVIGARADGLDCEG